MAAEADTEAVKLRGRHTTTLLDALGILEPERVAAIYFALPRERRDVMLRDGPCAIQIGRLAREIPDAEAAAVRDFVADTPPTELTYELARFDIERAETVATQEPRSEHRSPPLAPPRRPRVNGGSGERTLAQARDLCSG